MHCSVMCLHRHASSNSFFFSYRMSAFSLESLLFSPRPTLFFSLATAVVYSLAFIHSVQICVDWPRFSLSLCSFFTATIFSFNIVVSPRYGIFTLFVHLGNVAHFVIINLCALRPGLLFPPVRLLMWLCQLLVFFPLCQYAMHFLLSFNRIFFLVGTQVTMTKPVSMLQSIHTQIDFEDKDNCIHQKMPFLAKFILKVINQWKKNRFKFQSNRGKNASKILFSSFSLKCLSFKSFVFVHSS